MATKKLVAVINKNDIPIYMLNFIKKMFSEPEDSANELKKSKHILLMRHASSDQGINDIDRTLNYEGLKEPLAIAYSLQNQKIALDKALVSEAGRAIKTYEIMRTILKGFPEPLFERKLYNAFEKDVLEVLREAATDCDRILVIGHNPSMIEVLRRLTGEEHEFGSANLAILTPKGDSLFASLEKTMDFNFSRMLYP